MPSPQHQVLTWVIPVIRRRTEVHDPEQVRHDVLAAQADADPAPPRRVARAFDVRRREAFGMPVFELRPRGGEPRRTVLYLHGGGFVSGLDRLHWRYAARLVRDLGVRVVLPSYPLTPTHTWRDALPRLVELFDELAGEVDGPSAEGVVLVGDSAGGGLAVSLAQLTTGQSTGKTTGLRPTHLVVFAPWLDLTGRTPGTDEAASTDPWLSVSKLRLFGGWWGDGDPAAPEVSPLSGDLGGLPPSLVMCGTRDLLLPQSRALVAGLEAAGTPVRYVEERGLLHVYPLLPIPESRRAWRQVRAFL